jgi:hypothetical protein
MADVNNESKEIILEGSICASESDKEFLESIGVVVGPFNQVTSDFMGCIVTSDVLEKLDPYWGTIYWSLHPVRKALPIN